MTNCEKFKFFGGLEKYFPTNFPNRSKGGINYCSPKGGIHISDFTSDENDDDQSNHYELTAEFAPGSRVNELLAILEEIVKEMETLIEIFIPQLNMTISNSNSNS